MISSHHRQERLFDLLQAPDPAASARRRHRRVAAAYAATTLGILLLAIALVVLAREPELDERLCAIDVVP